MRDRTGAVARPEPAKPRVAVVADSLGYRRFSERGRLIEVCCVELRLLSRAMLGACNEPYQKATAAPFSDF